MSEILFIHRDLSVKGGAESVCMNMIEALQRKHQIALATTSTPDIHELNEYYQTGVSIDNLDVHTVQPTYGVLNRLPFDATLCKWALFIRYVRKIGAGFDHVINTTASDITLPYRTIQYVHNPRPFSVHNPGRSNPLRYGYYKLCEKIFGFDTDLHEEDVFLANSEWTSRRISEQYGKGATVLYPPVVTDGFYEVPWEERESGFLTIGRIGPSKNLLENIEIIRRVRDLGHEIHYHIIGPPGNQEYYRRVRREVADHDYIDIIGEISRDQLVELLCTHRYGLHGKKQEHFGMVIAEMVSGGMIPFVPDDGGQCEIVNHAGELIYSSTDEAVALINRVLTDEEETERIRDLLDNGTNFRQRSFEEEFLKACSL